MKKITFKPVLTAVAAAVALSACTMMPKYEQPQVAVADTFKYDTVDDGIRAAELGWQDYFADPRLHRLIDIALERNTDLRTAALNAEIYRKQYMIARNNLLPTVNASGTGSRQGSLSGGSVSSQYSVGLGAASYELDLFGRVRSTSEAALQGYFNVA
ncbi:TolC family protein, partial [Neisseria sp. P0021.S005]